MATAPARAFASDPTLTVGRGPRARTYVLRPWWKRLLRALGIGLGSICGLALAYGLYVYWAPPTFWLYAAAIWAQKPALFARLAAWGLDPNVKGFGGYSPLHLLVDSDDLTPGCDARIRALIDAGADPNARGPGGLTPLHVLGVSLVGRSVFDRVDPLSPQFVLAAARALLASGADPNLATDNGGRFLHSLCFSKGLASLVHELSDAGADLEVQDSLSYRPLHYAVVNDDASLVAALLQRYANKRYILQ